MIFKSYQIEENINLLQNKIVLFYGENLGLIDEFKKTLNNINKNVIKFSQEEILQNENVILNEVQHISLFEDKKVFFISNANDKIINIIEELHPIINENRIYLFTNILDKKSKLRREFENNKNLDIIPCYNDNEITIRKIILKKLKGFSGITPEVLNTLISNCSYDRIKLNNEIEKIKTFFIEKSIQHNLLEELLNLKNNNDFETLRDNVLNGRQKETNNYLSSTVIETDKIPLYLNIINQRLNKLKEVSSMTKNGNLSEAINRLKPPIFWKDKNIFFSQAKLWNLSSLNNAISKTYETEIKIKSMGDLNKNILIKKLLLDICLLASS